mgnify:CR=1 FL=1
MIAGFIIQPMALFSIVIVLIILNHRFIWKPNVKGEKRLKRKAFSKNLIKFREMAELTQEQAC